MSHQRCYVGSEIGSLRRVILHRPELSLERLTPTNSKELLFDDVLRVEKAGKEHDYFSQLLRNEGVEVYLLRNLLAEVLDQAKAREWLIDQHCSPYFLGDALSKETKAFLHTKDHQTMASFLLDGITVSELPKEIHSLVRDLKYDTDFILPPLPNHLFTRDTSCWIYNGVSINPMAKSARKHETWNLKAVYNFHPLFKHAEFNYWYGNESINYGDATLEGGDVMIIGKGLVLIGMGERSTPQAVEILANTLFAHHAAKCIIAVQLPKDRASMHLDTVMTMLDFDCFSIYPPVIDHVTCFEIKPKAKSHLSVSPIKENLFDYIARFLGVNKIRLVPTGGNLFQMEREQWNDANNVLAIRPGVVIGYERNRHTLENMSRANITVLTIPGDELGRGRGGARCMSCPFDRDDLK